MKRTASVLGAILVLLVAAPAAQAAGTDCDIVPAVEDAVRDAPAVFVGEVIRVDRASDAAIVDVAWQWKGSQVPARVEVAVASEDSFSISATERAFRPGQQYLIITANAFDPFVVDECTPLTPYVADGSVIPANLWGALGNSTPTKPAAIDADGTGPIPPSITDVVAVGALAAAGFFIARALLMRMAKIRRERAERPKTIKKRHLRWIQRQQEIEADQVTSGDRRVNRNRRFWRRQRKKRDRILAQLSAAEAGEVQADRAKEVAAPRG